MKWTLPRKQQKFVLVNQLQHFKFHIIMWLEVTVHVGDDQSNENTFLAELPHYTNIRSLYKIVGTLIEQRYEMCATIAESYKLIKDNNCMIDELTTQMIAKFKSAYMSCCTKDKIQHRRALHTNFLQREIVAMKEAIAKILPVSSQIGQSLLKKMDQIEKDLQHKLKIELTAFGKPIVNEEIPVEKSDTKKQYEKRLYDYFGKNDKTRVKVKALIIEPLPLLSNAISLFETCEQFCSEYAGSEQVESRKRSAEEEAGDEEDGFFIGFKRRKTYNPSQRSMGRRRLRISEDLALKPQQLEYINRSNVIKDKVRYSDELKQKILEIDTAYDRESRLDQLMQSDSEFTVFCNELLFIMGEKELAEVYPPKDAVEEEELMNIISSAANNT
jgi:hypothetical protein